METNNQDFVAESTGAIKADASKAPIELIDPEFILGLSQVLKHGAEKYAEHNWAKGLKWSRLIGSSMRHLLAFASGEDVDPETGLSHLYHLGCNAMFLAYHQKYKKELDDRFFASKPNIAASVQVSESNDDLELQDCLSLPSDGEIKVTQIDIPKYPPAYILCKSINEEGISSYVIACALPLSFIEDVIQGLEQPPIICGEALGSDWGWVDYSYWHTDIRKAVETNSPGIKYRYSSFAVEGFLYDNKILAIKNDVMMLVKQNASEDDGLPEYLIPPTTENSRRFKLFRLSGYPTAYLVTKRLPNANIKVFAVVPLSWLVDYPQNKIAYFMGETLNRNWGYDLDSVDKKEIFGSEINISNYPFRFREVSVSESSYARVFVEREQQMRKFRAAVVIANR